MNVPNLRGQRATPKQTAAKAPAHIRFLQRVRVRPQASEHIQIEGTDWVKFYAGATGRVIRFNMLVNTIAVVFDTGNILSEGDRIMEEFEERYLEPISEDEPVLIPRLGAMEIAAPAPAAAVPAEEEHETIAIDLPGNRQN